MEDAPHVVGTAWCVEKGVFVVSVVWDPTWLRECVRPALTTAAVVTIPPTAATA